MAVIRKRKYKNDWNYVIDFVYRGRRHTKSTGTKDRKLALEILGEVQAQISRGTFSIEKSKKKDIRLVGFITEFLKYSEGHKSQSTISLERMYFHRVAGKLGNVPLRNIDRHLIDTWRAQFSKEVSPSTFNIVLRSLHAAFNVAKVWGYVDSNPFKDIEQLKVQERRLYLFDRELEAIFRLIDEDIAKAEGPGGRPNVITFRKSFRLYVEFLLNTGLRREEALNLRHENIDLIHNVIYVEKTKTRQMRAIPLNGRSRRIIEVLGETLFSKLNKHDVTNKFRFYLKQAGLKGFKLHSLRHTFATRLLALGVDIYTISRLLGHTDIKTSMIYAKTNVESLRSVVEKLNTSCYAIVTWDGKKENGQ